MGVSLCDSFFAFVIVLEYLIIAIVGVMDGVYWPRFFSFFIFIAVAVFVFGVAAVAVITSAVVLAAIIVGVFATGAAGIICVVDFVGIGVDVGLIVDNASNGADTVGVCVDVAGADTVAGTDTVVGTDTVAGADSCLGEVELREHGPILGHSISN